MDWVSEVTGEVGETVVEMRYRVPEGYLEGEVERVRMPDRSCWEGPNSY